MRCVCLCVLEKDWSEQRFFVTPKKVEIFMKSWLFSKMPRKLPGSFYDAWGVTGSILDCTGSYFRWPNVGKKIPKFSTFFHAWWRFSVLQLFGGCRSRVRVPTQYAWNRAGCVECEGEGSTGPSRGEQRLTVYRAHASRDQEGVSKSGKNSSEKWRYLRICEFNWRGSNFPI